MTTGINVFTPNDRVIRLKGARSDVSLGSPGGGGAGSFGKGVSDLINAFKGLSQDRDNKLLS